MQDKVILKDVSFQCRIGCTEAERDIPQTIILDATLAFDIRSSAKSEQLEDTICYIEVYNCIKQKIEERKYILVETLIEELAQELLKHFPIQQISLLIKKPQPMKERGGGWVGVEITRP